MTAPFDFEPRTRVVFGAGAVSRVGELARGLGFRRTLLVADPGLLRAGHAERVGRALREAEVEVVGFHGVGANPDTAMVEAGAARAREAGIDSLVALGGGSSLDCAKGIGFVLANGGSMADYRGYGRAAKPLPPMIGVPTTAGTGSEAQSYALISDARTHEKMACGDPSAAFRVAVLDPELTLSQPALVSATAGYDALSHAVETWVTTRRSPLSDLYAGEAFRLLAAGYERVLRSPRELEARAGMLLGAHYAGVAIEHSMLGATHACANPLTARHGASHGAAIALLLPHVVRWNGAVAGERYAELLGAAATADPGAAGEVLARRLEGLRTAGGLPGRLRDIGVREDELASLAADAAEQWTGRFNPRPLDAEAALALYRCAF